MVLSPRLELRQGQTLVMTPQLQQAIKLLQLSNLELSAYVEQELEQNPLLERDDESRANAAEDADGDAAPAPAPGEKVGPGDEASAMEFSADGDNAFAAGESLDADYDDVWDGEGPSDGAAAEPDDGHGSGGGDNWSESGTGASGDTLDTLEQTLSEKPSLREHLTSQLGLDVKDPGDRAIGLQLIEMLDGAGYVTGDMETLAEQMGCPTARVLAVLARLQQFDPPGIFARNLRECLALQLMDKNRLDPATEALLDNLELVAQREFDALTRLCSVDREDLRDMLGELRALNPKPALAFDETPLQPVTPDIFMRPKQGGGWIIELNNDTLPRVLINNQYCAQVRRIARSKVERRYINSCLQSANWLVKSLHQRATTILRVATEIVTQQDRFFRQGIQQLKPLILRDIAESIDMHECTVSRVTTNKYMATPRGIFELKYFFTPSLASSLGGDAHSSESARHRIRDLIDSEDVDSILSDDSLAEALKLEGIDIARRTVAKYRGIPGHRLVHATAAQKDRGAAGGAVNENTDRGGPTCY